jgi:hypothetical protein
VRPVHKLLPGAHAAQHPKFITDHSKLKSKMGTSISFIFFAQKIAYDQFFYFSKDRIFLGEGKIAYDYDNKGEMLAI